MLISILWRIKRAACCPLLFQALSVAFFRISIFFVLLSGAKTAVDYMSNYTLHTDADLLDLMRSGDHLAFAEIYHRYKLTLHHHALTKLGDTTEAQDAIQEVFSNLWLKREVLNITQNLSGYLYTSVRNYILNLIARKEVQDKYISSMLHFSSEKQIVTDHRVRENMLQQAIEREIAGLPEKMRQVFELSRKQHLSNKEIAAIMGTSEQTVKKQISNTLKLLRGRLGLVAYCYLLFFYRG